MSEQHSVEIKIEGWFVDFFFPPNFLGIVYMNCASNREAIELLWILSYLKWISNWSGANWYKPVNELRKEDKQREFKILIRCSCVSTRYSLQQFCIPFCRWPIFTAVMSQENHPPSPIITISSSPVLQYWQSQWGTHLPVSQLQY